MEDDDEFGDLYTDVLKPFSSLDRSSSSHHITFPLEFNRQVKDEGIVNISEFQTSIPEKALVDVSEQKFDATAIVLGAAEGDFDDSRVLSGRIDEKFDDITGGSKFIGPDLTDLAENKQVDIADDSQFVADKVCGTVLKEDADKKGDILGKNSYDLGTVEDNCVESSTRGLVVSRNDEKQGSYDFLMKEDGGEEVDNWDSDSDDDLQIVLNVNNKSSIPIRRQVSGSDDDDEDGDPLVIVADDVHGHQQVEENEWCEDVTHPTDGDQKDATEIGKPNGPISIVPKIGYSGHAHYPFNSQFKYVRPGATSTPAGGSGAPGVGASQVRPFVSASSMSTVAGRGRGDWRQTGIKVAPSIQKNFQPGFGFPWANNIAGRGGYNGGLEFTIPSHKSIFDVDIDSIEDQPWKLPGTDISDFFNFGLNEESWKEYCKQIEQSKLEASMQTKIRVYESGRTDQEFDPDLPPELAAVAGTHDSTPELSKSLRVNITQSEQLKGPLTRVRPPLPTGRSIQVETGYGERLPSVDTRPPRIRDSDAIIEIVLQDSLNDDCTTENDAPEQQEVAATEKRFCGSRDDGIVSINYCDVVEEHVGVKGKSSRRGHLSNSNTFRTLDGDRSSSFGVDGFSRQDIGYEDQIRSPHQDEGTSRREERLIRGRRHGLSPSTPAGENLVIKQSSDNQKETKKTDGDKAFSPEDKKCVGVGDDNITGKHDVNMKYDHNPPVETTNTTLVDVNRAEIVKSDTSQHVRKRQRLSSHVEQVIHEKTDDTTTCSSDNNRERTRGRRDHQKSHLDVAYRDTGHVGNAKRNGSENESGFRRATHDPKQETGNLSHAKYEAADKRKEKESLDSHRKDQGSRHRAKTIDCKKQGHDDVPGSRHRSNHRECDRNDKDDHHGSRKPSGNGDSRPHPEKELVSRHREREDNLKCRNDGSKSNDCVKRDHSEVDVPLNREGGNHRKRERDGVLDERKRDEKPRARSSLDDHHSSSRHKDDGIMHRGRVEKPREREDQNRPKQVNEDNSSKKNNSDGRGTAKCGWGVDNSSRIASFVKMKDECSGSDKDRIKEIRGGDPIKQKDPHDGGHGHLRGGDDANEDRKLRQGRSRAHSDHSRHRDHQVVKSKTCEVDQPNAVQSMENRDDHVVEINGAVDLQVTDEHIPKGEERNSGSCDEKDDLRRGRSKLERWASQKEAAAVSNPSNSLPSPLLDNPVEDATGDQAAGNEEEDKLVEERHLETIAKLKKRSERFKLPMPGEKESTAVKKTENEMLPPPPPPPPPLPLPPFLMEESAPGSETDMKSERPNRKRRWTSN